MSFASFVDEIQTNRWNVYGTEVYENGKLVDCYGDTTRTRYPIYSATKTITSIAAGMAMDERKLELDQAIFDYLPQTAIAQLPPVQAETYRRLPLRRLLCMSVSGYPFRPSKDSWLTESLSIPLVNVDRPVFHYSNIPAYLVGVAVSCAVGEDLYDYLKRKLFIPLGMNEPPCVRCPDGYFYGASGMELTVHELSQIGLLLANEGVIRNQRLLSSKYIREATSVQQMNREGGYGYFIWKYREGFSINGKWGQKCFILPKEKKMITFLAHMEKDSDMLTKSMERSLLES